MGVTADQRMVAQGNLEEVCSAEMKEFEREIDSIGAADFGWRETDERVGNMAGAEISKLMSEWADASTPPPVAYEELHQFRILGKRMRYSMEIFADCFTSPFREELYPAVEDIQEILGLITDAHVAIERISALALICVPSIGTTGRRFKSRSTS